MKKTSPTRQNIPQNTPFSVQEGLTFIVSQRGDGECKSRAHPVPQPKLCVLGPTMLLSSLPEDSNGTVAPARDIGILIL